MFRNTLTQLVAIVSSLMLVVVPNSASAEENVATQSTTISFNNPCAVFHSIPQSATVNRINYGETVEMNIDYTAEQVTHGEETTGFKLKIYGEGIGVSSNLLYKLAARSSISVSNNDLESGTLKLDVKTRLSSSGNPAAGTMLNSNAGLTFQVGVQLNLDNNQENPTWSFQANNFDLSCADEQWQDLTSQNSRNASGGKGFGDPWNKYAWSMKDFNQSLYVGTKNAHFDYQKLQNPTDAVAACESNLAGSVPQIYLGLACLELYDSDQANNPGASARDAKIYSYGYRTRSWTENTGTATSQGFRVMEKHNGKLYAGSDLGSFIMGVELGSRITDGDTDKWNFPGSRILVNNGGENWTAVDCQPSELGGHDKPCNSSTDPIHSSVLGDINTSFRALASYDGSLYLGTFNYAGAELWKYDETVGGNPWSLIAKFDGIDYPRSSTISELKALNGKLYIGLGFGPALSNSYLYEFDGTGPAQVVENLPNANGGSSVFKLFASQSGELYVGLVDFNNGFNLYAFKPGRETPWRIISEDGFENSANVYVWSMAELNGKIILGTFNTDMLSSNTLPRGSAELWSSADDGHSWQQQATPLGFSALNYGIRTMEVGDGHLYLGTASNMLAPDVISELPNLPNVFNIGAGAQIWRLGDPSPTQNLVGTITPEKPSLALGQVSENTAEIHWPLVVHADSYEVSLNGQKVATTSVSEFSHIFQGLKSNTTYVASVKAINGGEASVSSEIEFRTDALIKLTLRFEASSGKLTKASKKLIQNMSKVMGPFTSLKFIIAANPVGKTKPHISKVRASRNVNEVTATLSRLGFSAGEFIQHSKVLKSGTQFSPVTILSAEVSYN